MLKFKIYIYGTDCENADHIVFVTDVFFVCIKNSPLKAHGNTKSECILIHYTPASLQELSSTLFLLLNSIPISLSCICARILCFEDVT